MPATIQPELILRELAELWISLAHPEQGASTASGVLRACSMTLLVAAIDEKDAQDVGQTVAELMHEHPSRAIVLKPAPAETNLDARVFAQCWMPFGSRQQICCEEIEITTPVSQIDAVSRVILGLLAPDLPAVMWCRGTHWFDRSGFEQIYPLIDKIILDSCAFGDVQKAFATMEALRRLRPRIGDLAWTRLTLWRELIAYTVEARTNGPARSIAVDYYGNKPSTSCLYLAAWLARAYPAATLSFRAVEGDYGRVAGVELAGDSFELTFRRLEGDTIRISGAHADTLVLPHANDYLAMREELTITGTDAIFEGVYSKALELKDGWQ